MISGLVLKYLNGDRLVILERYEAALPVSRQFPLTTPFEMFRLTAGQTQYYFTAIATGYGGD